MGTDVFVAVGTDVFVAVGTGVFVGVGSRTDPLVDIDSGQ